MKHQVLPETPVVPHLPLRPIIPTQYDRFSTRPTENDGGMIKHLPQTVYARSSIPAASDLAAKSQVQLVHPEGGLMICEGYLVSDSLINSNLREIGNQIVAQCSNSGMCDVTTFLRHRGDCIEYYVADHSIESIVWVDGQRPDTLRGLAEHRARNTLREEYWFHVESFPGSRFVDSKKLQKLKDVLAGLGIDSTTSDGSTAPFSSEQIAMFLTTLNAFSDSHTDEHQTFAVARIWNMIWHARVINNFGSSNACLDRFAGLWNNPAVFTGINAILARCTFGSAEKHLARCSRTWAGRIAYVAEWKQFKSRNEDEWKQVTELGSMLVIACLLLQGKCDNRIARMAPLFTALFAAASGHYMNTESQNLGSSAEDASVYFQTWETPQYNVQRIALRNAIPQTLLVWAFLMFGCAITMQFII